MEMKKIALKKCLQWLEQWKTSQNSTFLPIAIDLAISRINFAIIGLIFCNFTIVWSQIHKMSSAIVVFMINRAYLWP
jgi:hypothetical protein